MLLHCKGKKALGCGCSCPLISNFHQPEPTYILLSNDLFLQSAEVQHHCESGRDWPDPEPKVRLAPEGCRGTRGDPHRNMCQRADAVPSYKSLPGSLRERIRGAVSSVGGTAYGGAMAASAAFGRAEGKVACCEKCSATLVALKKQALSLAVHHHFSCKVSGDARAQPARGGGGPGIGPLTSMHTQEGGNA